MATDKKNIIVGAARFFIGTASASKPAATSATPYGNTVAAATGWREVGYTQEGVEVSYEPEYGDVEVDQNLDSARVFKTAMRVMINTTFAEATLENLVVVWGQSDKTYTSSSSTLVIEGGSLGQAPVERQLIAVGNGTEAGSGQYAGQYNERTYHALRALSVESSSHALRRNEATVFPVSFRLLPSDAEGAPYGTIVDRARNW